MPTATRWGDNKLVTTIEEVKELISEFENRVHELNLNNNTCFVRIKNHDSVYRFNSQWDLIIMAASKLDLVEVVCVLHKVRKNLESLESDHSKVFNEAMYCLNNYVEYAGMVE